MNKIFFQLTFTLLVVSVYNQSFSQENYLEGYVINNNQDTVYGFIDYRNWNINPQLIKFKERLDSITTIIYPAGITEFGVEDEIYVTGTVEVEVSPRSVGQLEYNPTLKTKTETVFLQTLISGVKSLYFLKDPKGHENFYIKRDAAFDLLIYKKYLRLIDTERVIAENKRYLGQLNLYLAECPSLNSTLSNLSYNKKSFTKVFQEYYRCSGHNIDFQKRIEIIKIEKGLKFGGTATFFNIRSTSSYLADAAFNQSYNITAGVFFNAVLPRNQGRWSINNEILFSSFDVTGHYEDFQMNAIIDIGYSYLKINNLLKYKFSAAKIHTYLNIGISNGIMIVEKNNKVSKKLIGFSTVTEERALEDIRKHEQGWILGYGVQYSNFSIETRFESGNGISPYINISTKSKRLYLLLSYKL
ncbi:MAG: hypothetical protein ABFS32_11715 [Bacteroidota bacterium]